MIALASATFLAGSLIGAWIAPSIRPAGWSAGSAQVELHGGVSRTDTVRIECNSGVDGTRIGISTALPPAHSGLAADSLFFDFSVQAESPLGGGPIPVSSQISLLIGTGAPGTGQAFGYDPETGSTVLGADGTYRQGRVTFTNMPRETDKSGDPSPDVTTLSGLITWTCDPAHDVPTPIDGSWFQ